MSIPVRLALALVATLALAACAGEDTPSDPTPEADGPSAEEPGTDGPSDPVTVTLLAMHGPADGVTTDGLAFALEDARLEAGSSRGVSNRCTGAASVSVRRGALVAIQPGT